MVCLFYFFAEAEGRETTGTLWTSTGGLQNVGHTEVYMNDSILNKAENETSGGLSGDDITGGQYEQVRQMVSNSLECYDTNRIYDGVEAEKRKSQASFQII